MKFLQNTLLASAAVALSLPAFSAIRPATDVSSGGDGDMFLVIFDAANEVSLTLDLGDGINTFRSTYDYNTAPSSLGKSWTVDSTEAAFVQFAAKAGSSADWGWFVMGGDSVGNNAYGSRGLVTTVTAGQGTSDIIRTRNGDFNAILPPMGDFIGRTNGLDLPTESDFSLNSYSFGDKANGAYALDPNLSGTNGANFAKWTNDNKIGTSADFYYVSRSGSSNLAFVRVDQFDNAIGASTFALNAAPGGAYTLAFTAAAAPIPEPGTYALLLSGLAMVGALARRRRA